MVNVPDTTTFSGSLALSSDGSKLCFTTLDAKGTTSIWVRDLDSVIARQLPGTEAAQFPFLVPGWTLDRVLCSRKAEED